MLWCNATGHFAVDDLASEVDAMPDCVIFCLEAAGCRVFARVNVSTVVALDIYVQSPASIINKLVRARFDDVAFVLRTFHGSDLNTNAAGL